MRFFYENNFETDHVGDYYERYKSARLKIRLTSYLVTNFKHMKKTTLLLLCSLLTLQLFAQKTIKDADSFFDNEDYIVALRYYQKFYLKDSLNPELNYKMGVCYLNCNANPKKALKHLLVAQPKKDKTDFVFLYELAWAFMNNKNFTKALDLLQQSKNHAINNPEFVELIDLRIDYIKNAQKYYKRPINVSFNNLGKYINTPMDDITPVISAYDETLLYTNNQRYDRTYDIYTFDVYYTMLSKKGYGKKKPLTGVNSVEDEFIAGASALGDKIFVQLQTFDFFEDLAVVSKKGKRFGKKEVLLGGVNSKQAEYGATLSLTGDTLYFSSKGNDTKGGLDIFMSRRLPNGQWSAPTNLGSKINSKYDEDFPQLAPDGRTLYFCSNNNKSMGGFDVFKTRLLPNGEWTEPKNIGYPLNDVFDNKTIAFSSDQRYAYVSKNRPDSYGYNDIYQVIFNDTDPSVKILMLYLKTGDKENNAPFGETDTSLSIVTEKGDDVFGTYAYVASKSKVTIALPPGKYRITINGDKTNEYSFKMNVPDSPGTTKIIKKTIFLKPKK